MLKPPITPILKKGENYYEFVVAVARKARQIAEEAEEEKVPLEGKPVTLAVEMFADGTEKFQGKLGSNDHSDH